MTGKRIRYSRLFGENRNPVVVAVDHGAEFGPTEGVIDLNAALMQLKNADGILINPGMLDISGDFFAQNGAPHVILRVTWTTAYCFPWNYRESHTCCVMRPQDALAAGATFIMACCLLQSGSEKVDRDNVRLFTEIVKEKELAGIPLIGELFPVDAEMMPQEELHQRIYRGTRILVELGADAIKTFYTGDRFSEIVEAVPVPVMALGASKKDSEQDAIDLAKRAVTSGSRGVVFGRNVFQSAEPANFLTKLKQVVQ